MKINVVLLLNKKNNYNDNSLFLFYRVVLNVYLIAKSCSLAAEPLLRSQRCCHLLTGSTVIFVLFRENVCRVDVKCSVFGISVCVMHLHALLMVCIDATYKFNSNWT